MENVKKCKNFLSTLIKLASSGKQSTETAANVKELVQHLLVRASPPARPRCDTAACPGSAEPPCAASSPRLEALVEVSSLTPLRLCSQL